MHGQWRQRQHYAEFIFETSRGQIATGTIQTSGFETLPNPTTGRSPRNPGAFMKRILVITGSLATAVMIGLGATAYAQAPQSAPGAAPSAEPRTERSERRTERMERRAARMEERMNGRIERLKADLKLNPQQEALWGPVQEQLARIQGERRSFRAANAGRFRDAELPDRMELMADRQARGAQNLRDLSAAVKPLWATLTPEQKETVRKAMPGRGRGEGRGEGRGDRRG
jgi:TolA-binding protein